MKQSEIMGYNFLDSFLLKSVDLKLILLKKGRTMLRAFNNLPDFYQGVLYILAGVVVLLYALGILTKGITMVIILFACYLILRGAFKSGLYDKIAQMMHKHNKR